MRHPAGRLDHSPTRACADPVGLRRRRLCQWHQARWEPDPGRSRPWIGAPWNGDTPERTTGAGSRRRRFRLWVWPRRAPAGNSPYPLSGRIAGGDAAPGANTAIRNPADQWPTRSHGDPERESPDAHSTREFPDRCRQATGYRSILLSDGLRLACYRHHYGGLRQQPDAQWRAATPPLRDRHRRRYRDTRPQPGRRHRRPGRGGPVLHRGPR